MSKPDILPGFHWSARKGRVVETKTPVSSVVIGKTCVLNSEALRPPLSACVLVIITVSTDEVDDFSLNNFVRSIRISLLNCRIV